MFLCLVYFSFNTPPHCCCLLFLSCLCVSICFYICLYVFVIYVCYMCCICFYMCLYAFYIFLNVILPSFLGPTAPNPPRPPPGAAAARPAPRRQQLHRERGVAPSAHPRPTTPLARAPTPTPQLPCTHHTKTQKNI